MSMHNRITRRWQLAAPALFTAPGLGLTTAPAATAAAEAPRSMSGWSKRPTVTLTALVALLVLLLTAATSSLSPRPAQAKTPPEYYQIENRTADLCLAVPTTFVSARASLLGCSDAGDKLWRLEPYGAFYRIRVLHTNMCLNVGNASHLDGERIVQHPCVGATNEQWRLDRVGNGYYKIVARHSLKCLDKDGYAVVQWTCHGATWQQWRFAVEPTF